MVDLVPLHALPAGYNGRVVAISGCPQHVQRLNEMGIRDGDQVQMIRNGTPCIIRTGTQTLCMRGNDLLNVLVQPGASREHAF